VVADHLLLDPAADRVDADDLPAGIVDVGVGGERGEDRVGVEGVNGGDVVGDDAGELRGGHVRYLPWSWGGVALRSPRWRLL
jgi:hypothetical protein